jgi:tRNA 5-methylaminomethyl-2-thiouridine biosynthesis bifunctional protein
MATGANTAQLLPEWQPFLQLNKGQVSHVLETDWRSALNCVLSYGGYATPAVDGITCVGATFEEETPLGLTQVAHEHNLMMLKRVMPQALNANVKPIGGHSAYRVMTADHLPLVGQALNVSGYRERMRACPLHPDTCPDAKDLLLPNLWFSIGHGSRGLTSSFLAAAQICAAITGQNNPISERLAHAVHPARVIFRQMAQNAIR